MSEYKRIGDELSAEIKALYEKRTELTSALHEMTNGFSLPMTEEMQKLDDELTDLCYTIDELEGELLDHMYSVFDC